MKEQSSVFIDQVVTRSAIPGDLATLLRFEQGVIAAERPFDDTLKKGDIHYYDLAAMIEAPDAEVVVATLGGTIVGSGYARIERGKPFYEYTHYGYLGFMYVSPDHRGQGVNQKILAALKEWARSRGLTEICLEVYAGNLPAIKAYEKAGFVPNLIQMRFDLRNNDAEEAGASTVTG